MVDEDLVTLQFINQLISTVCSDSSAKPAVIYRVGGVGTNFIFKQKGTCIFLMFYSFLISFSNENSDSSFAVGHL